MSKNYYTILGITDEDIKLSDEEFIKVVKEKYRKIALTCHPDRQRGKSEAEKKEAEKLFKEATEAKEKILLDINERTEFLKRKKESSNNSKKSNTTDANKSKRAEHTEHGSKTEHTTRNENAKKDGSKTEHTTNTEHDKKSEWKPQHYDNYEPKKKNKYYRIYCFMNDQNILYAYIEERRGHLFWKRWKRTSDSIALEKTLKYSAKNKETIDMMKSTYISSRKKYNCIFQGFAG